MADVTISYQGNTISELNDSGNKSIKTAGKFCKDDISIVYTKPSNAQPSGSVDPSLPSAYQAVEYITFDGNEYMLVEDLPTDYMLHILASNRAVLNESAAVGYRETSNNNMDFEVRFQRNAPLNLWVRSSTYGNQVIPNNPNTNVLNVICEAAFNLIGQSRMKFFIGTYSPSLTDLAFDGNLYALKLYEPRVAGKLTQFKAVRNFVPCYRLSDGVIGVYEVYTSTFYQNEGTGTLAKGPDVT